MDRQAPQARKVRILVIDDHELFRAGLIALTAHWDDLEIVGECGTAEQACRLASETQPDVVLLDADLGGAAAEGIELIDRLVCVAPEAAVIVFADGAGAPLPEAIMLQGARGVLSKNMPPGLLLRAIERVHAGELWFDRVEMGELLRKARIQPTAMAELASRLTPREHQLIALICDGLGNRQISEQLYISEKTVRNHLSGVFNKLGVSGRLGLAIFAFRHGLVRTPQLDA
jgi:two-component system, NarL family, nitrate/nitrite response regulator NarL